MLTQKLISVGPMFVQTAIITFINKRILNGCSLRYIMFDKCPQEQVFRMGNKLDSVVSSIMKKYKTLTVLMKSIE